MLIVDCHFSTCCLRRGANLLFSFQNILVNFQQIFTMTEGWEAKTANSQYVLSSLWCLSQYLLELPSSWSSGDLQKVDKLFGVRWVDHDIVRDAGVYSCPGLVSVFRQSQDWWFQILKCIVQTPDICICKVSTNQPGLVKSEFRFDFLELMIEFAKN